MLASLKEVEKLRLIEWIQTFTFSVSDWALGDSGIQEMLLTLKKFCFFDYLIFFLVHAYLQKNMEESFSPVPQSFPLQNMISNIQ